MCMFVYEPMDSKLYEFNSNLTIDKRQNLFDDKIRVKDTIDTCK